MSNMKLTAAPASEGSSFFANLRHKMPKDTGIFVVMLVIALTFEIAGWYVRDQSFLLNTNRLVLIVLQVAIIGIIAVGVTQVIITTGIDLSSGSVIALAAVVAASLAQTSDSLSPMFPALVNLPAVIPICAGIGVGLLCGLTNGFLVTRTGIPPFIATLGMMVSARGLAQYYTQGNPISFLSDSFTAIGQGAMPVIIFFVIAAVFHIALKHTRYGKYVYAIGGNMTSAKVSGINVNKYLVIVYTIAGAPSGLAGVVLAARVSSGQSSMGMSYELDAIAAAVIRVLMPLVADRLRESTVVTGAMVATALLFAVYPLLPTAVALGACSVLLGFALGSVQPMIMSMLHQLTPAHRHGEALGLRLMAINGSSVVMPLLFGTASALVGLSGLFWAVGATVGLGARVAWRLRGEAPAPPPHP